MLLEMLFRSVPAARFWSQDYKLVMEGLVWQFTHQFGGEPVSVFEKKSATKVSSHFVVLLAWNPYNQAGVRLISGRDLRVKYAPWR